MKESYFLNQNVDFLSRFVALYFKEDSRQAEGVATCSVFSLPYTKSKLSKVVITATCSVCYMFSCYMFSFFFAIQKIKVFKGSDYSPWGLLLFIHFSSFSLFFVFHLFRFGFV